MGPDNEDGISRSFLSGGDIFSLNPWDQFLFLDGDARLRELNSIGKISSTKGSVKMPQIHYAIISFHFA